jgi:hypothetical protein
MGGQVPIPFMQAAGADPGFSEGGGGAKSLPLHALYVVQLDLLFRVYAVTFLCHHR